MMITTRGRNALKVMIDLAMCDSDAPVALSEVATHVHESVKYLESAMAQLSAAGLVVSTRGKSGGYRLSRSPEEYSVLEIITAAEGSIAPVSCMENGEIHCENAPNCLTLPLWKELDEVIGNFLRSKTLADLLK